MAYDIVTIGSATLDHFADTDSELIRIDTRLTSESLLAYPLGGKVLIRELVTTTGGGGTNSATSFARLGFNTAFLGKLGDDVLAELILKQLAREGVEFIGARKGQTGVSFVLNGIREDRTILTHKGSNNELMPADIPAFDGNWIYLSSMLERSWDTVVEFLDTRSCRLESRNCRFAFNLSTYQAAMGYEKLRVVTDQAALLVMNREEACLMLGIDPRRRMATVQLIAALSKVPGQIIAITDGSSGAWLCADELVLSAKPQPGTKVIETTGAGDAFASTLTACHMRGMPLEQALHWAMTNAESVLQYKGAKEGLLTWSALQSMAERNPRAVQRHSRFVETGTL